ncbi:MAG: glyoxylate/hydroxypyruvate reductase A [Betaproteobacteria bacterium]|nr:glyoxylate/hydroxypyruvate reductase A [Betaproteobacteria bacterium]NBT10467.1 glyoxylate/hydroxypyruvate reductase A [Betaproteobacteria bacterium]NBU48897.1 glyoxylate/hydroxypyruvate reductase A [Betaproteobacteria bacterium]
MHVTFCCAGGDPGRWETELRRRIPNLTFSVWAPGAPPEADVALVWAPPQQFIDEQPQLKGLFNAAAGVDALLRLRLPPNLPIVRLEDAGMAVQMAEYVCHALIHDFRVFGQLDRQQREHRWQQPPAPDRRGYPVGVMGLGVLGRRVVQALLGFDYAVHTWTRTPPVDPPPGVHCHVGPDALDGFLGASRGLVCVLPLTPATRDILNRRHLSRLRPGGYVVNVARGAHVVDQDLIDLIDEGHLSGATLDVFRQEPLPTDHPFWAHPRIRVTPHTSARTLETSSVVQIVDKIAQVAAGVPWHRIGGWVDPQRGY